MNRIIPRNVKRLSDRRGAVLALVAILMVVLLGFAALAIDIGYLHVVKGQLQNAADAGALAGAAVLFNPNASPPDAPQGPDARATANDTTILNYSGGKPVPDPNVHVGHYCFGSNCPTSTDCWVSSSGSFCPNDSQSSQLPNWETMSFATLNTNNNFINAVGVEVTRNNVPAFFSRVFGNSVFTETVRAVAYVGFAGTLQPDTANQPIAICQQAILQGNNYDCSVGRMLNSNNAGNSTTLNTAGWTNFTQPCQTASSSGPNGVNQYICGGGNPEALLLGQGMGTTNGVADDVLSNLYDCWQTFEQGKNPYEPWSMTLPVIDCPSNNTGNCSTLVGDVNLDVIWVTVNNPSFDNPPEVEKVNADGTESTWSCPSNCGGAGACCWNDFVSFFNLQNLDGSPAIFQQKTIYFLPTCTPHIPEGVTGGQNFGILAKYPVLVK